MTNLFVYGPDAEPVDGAQLVDQDGRPFVLVDPISGGAWDPAMLGDYLATETDVPAGVVSGDVPLNVYPYRMVDADGTVWSDAGEPRLDLDLAADPRWPAGSLFPVPGFAPDGGNDAATPEDAATGATRRPKTRAANRPRDLPPRDNYIGAQGRSP